MDSKYLKLDQGQSLLSIEEIESLQNRKTYQKLPWKNLAIIFLVSVNLASLLFLSRQALHGEQYPQAFGEPVA